MDLGGVVAMDSFLCSSSENVGGLLLPPSSSSSPPPPTCDAERGILRNVFDTNFSKHERRSTPEEIDWRPPKAARTDTLLFPPAKEQILRFDSPAGGDAPVLSSDGPKTLPYYWSNPPWSPSAAASCLRSEGLSSGGLNASMHGALARVRGPFTPSQWMELEHQALIYKYLAANAPIPPNLLLSIRRSLSPSGFPPFSAGYYGSSSSGWGSFNMGCSGNADPEPGRCRRTDGKKWRCSRDAVADQKYCERHMNRGRHRSRKHVEAHSSNAAKPLSSLSTSHSVPALYGRGASSTHTVEQQQTEDLGTSTKDPCPTQFNRMSMNKGSASDAVQDSQSLSMQNSTIPKHIDSLFALSKQHNPFEEAMSGSVGIVSSESRLCSPRNSGKTDLVPTANLDHRHLGSHTPRHFLDEWPAIHTRQSAMTCPEVEEMHSSRTQLSISIPIASSDMSSSSASPNDEKLALSPLRLTRNFGPDRGIGVWMPMFCEASMGGPLGEVLINNSTAKDQSKNCISSALNLLTDGWDLSAHLESSPTGVLQKTAFGSVTSSTGSSPPPENTKAHDSTFNLHDDLGSILAKHPKFPFL